MSEEKIILHPIVDGVQDNDTNLYPKTSIAQVEGLNNKINQIETNTSDIASLQSAISEINSFTIEIVPLDEETFKPSVENPNTHTIYMTSRTSEEYNVYTEWLYVNNDFEEIGTTSIDLSNYQTKLTDTQLAACNSGITSIQVSNITKVIANAGYDLDEQLTQITVGTFTYGIPNSDLTLVYDSSTGTLAITKES